MDLTELCQELRNWFELDKQFGEFTIMEGDISLSHSLSLQDGQYYRIVGSVFNDGVYQYGKKECPKDETFDGAVWAMAVPPAVEKLLSDINAWLDKYGTLDSTNLSPFSSESFGGYSYSKGYSLGGSSGSRDGLGGVYAVFNDKLSRWRKV